MLCGVHVCLRKQTYMNMTPVLGATGYSEQRGLKNSISSKQLSMSRLQDTWITLEAFYSFLVFETWSPFTLVVWETTATPFSC